MHRICFPVASVGDSPSGKAVGSGPTIRGFESLIPSQENLREKKLGERSSPRDTKNMKNLELALVFFMF